MSNLVAIDFDKHIEIIRYKKGVEYRIYMDIEDYLSLDRALNITKNGYAVSRVKGDKRNLLLHRIVLNCYDKGRNYMVDHINQNKLDCRRINLRVCNKSQNQANVKVRKDSSSGYKGVYKRITRKGEIRYDAYIRINDKKVHIGTFQEAEEAAKAYNKKALDVFKEFSCLNEVT